MMTQSVTHVNDSWLYTFLIQPHLEGVERLNLVWGKKDTRGFVPKNLSLKDRLIYLISGIALMIPFIATIVWLSMQTFGHPDSLSESYREARISLNQERVY